MSVNIDIFKSVLESADETLKKYGFEQKADENGQYISEADGALNAFFAGSNGAVKLSYADEKITAYSGTDAENLDNTPKRILLALLPSDAGAKDISFVVNEFCDTLNDKYGVKTPSARKSGSSQKMPQTVSKAAVKNGSFYDPNTLASKLCLVFPEIRETYKQNVSDYGELLSEEFFTEYVTPRVVDAIKENKPATMKKLFQILNEIYEDGTNDTQGVIAVTILGGLNNDQVLLARCVDYMSETMAPPVIEVNKFLATSAGKKAKKKLENPPAYKPKKKKKPGLMDKMMSAGSGIQQQ